MRILLVGHFDNLPDEGTRIVARNFASEISNHGVETLAVDWHHIWDSKSEIESYSPRIVHAVGGPSSRWLFHVLSKLRRIRSRPRIVFSALQPTLKKYPAVFTSGKPDLALIQSSRSERFFNDAGVQTEYVMNGVDMARFRPADSRQRESLRRTLGLKNEEMILSIGAINHGRGVGSLASVVDENRVVFLVVPQYSRVDKRLRDSLVAAGCRLVRGHLTNIEKLYQAADIFVFTAPPETPTNSIDCPLSVLEAMSSNLCVASTAFGTIPRMFSESNHFRYYNGLEELAETICQLSEGRTTSPPNRQMASPYSWPNVAERIAEVYSDVDAMQNG